MNVPRIGGLRTLSAGRVVMLASLALLVSACRLTATPEPPVSSPKAQPTFPVVAPPGVPPLTGRGALAVIPPGDGQTVAVPMDLGEGWLATAYVLPPATTTTLRLQVLPGAEISRLVSSGDSANALAMQLDFYDESTSALLNVPPGSVSLAVRPPDRVDVTRLVVHRRAPGAADFIALDTTSDTATHAVGARLPQASSLVLAVAPAVPTVAQPAQSVQTTEFGNRAPLPQRVKIAALGVDAAVTPLGLEPSGIMASPTEGHIVGWYELGPRPGEMSNAILAGHVDWNKQAAVFIDLSKLQPGETIEIQSGANSRYRYEVDEVRLYPLEDAPLREIFGATPGPALTLITCGGAFDQTRREYLERVVVRAHGV